MAIDESVFYFIAAPALILGVIFLIFMVFALLRLKTVVSAQRANGISLLFYLFIALETILRTGLYLYIAIESDLYSNEPMNSKNPMDDKVFLTFEYLPDTLFWVIFTLLLWQLLLMFYETHANNRNSGLLGGLGAENCLNPMSKKRVYLCFVSAWVVYLVVQIVCISLYQSDIITLGAFAEQNSMFNLLLPVILLVIEVYLHINFSGTPYISLLASQKKGIINKVLLVWAIGRVLHAVWSVYIAFYVPHLFYDVFTGKGEIDDSTYNELFVIVSLEVADKIVNEALPFLFVFDLEFVRLFYTAQAHKSGSFPSNNTTANDNAYSLLYAEKQRIPIKPPLEFDSLEIVPLSESEAFERKNGFGTLSLCCIKPDFVRKYLLRRLKMKGFSSFLAEEFINELAKQAELQNNTTLRLNKLVNYAIHEENSNERFLCLLFEYCPNGSLANLLRTQQNLDFRIKARTALELAAVFEVFHSYEPPLVHGHLKSANILFDEEFRPIISDFGFFTLKKYYTIMHSYSQKSIYTAPELLKSNVFRREKSADVYAFGMILYEIFVGKIENEALNKKQLTRLVCEEKGRPKIPEECEKKMANLIRCCWQEDPAKRPNFTQIRESLSKILAII